MEFAVVICGAVMNTALAKLSTAFSALRGHEVDARRGMMDKLSLINSVMQNPRSIFISYSSVQIECITQFQRLAADIEDCVERFHVKKMTPKQFIKKVDIFKARTTDKFNMFKACIDIEEFLGPQPTAPPSRVAGVPDGVEVLPGKTLTCLIYLCMFPPDHHIRRSPLIRQWLAEELVDVHAASDCLKALTTGKIIEPVQERNNGIVKTCRSPENLLQYITEHSRLRNFILICDDMERQVDYVRRLSVRPNGAENGVPNLPEDLSHLRTLAVYPTTDRFNYEAVLNFAGFEVLRLLDLKECSHLTKRHVKAMCDQLMLKYLSLGGTTISRVPREIGNLQQLETLDLGKTKIVTVHSEVLKLPRLKHLLGKFRLFAGDIIFLRKRNLKRSLEKTSKLETLSGFAIGKRQGFPQLMSSMSNLRRVKIWCKSTADTSNMADASKAIEKFIRDGDGNPGDRFISIDFKECSTECSELVLRSLHCQGTLKSLKLHGELTGFLNSLDVTNRFVTKVTSIEELCLSSTNLNWDNIISALQNLTALKYLKLLEEELESFEIIPGNITDRLERIYLVGKRSLKDITIQAGALGFLRSLRLNCWGESLQRITIEADLPALISLQLLCEPLAAAGHGIQIGGLVNLKEITLYSEVHTDTRDFWRNAAGGHPNTPNVSFIPKPIPNQGP